MERGVKVSVRAVDGARHLFHLFAAALCRILTKLFRKSQCLPLRRAETGHKIFRSGKSCFLLDILQVPGRESNAAGRLSGFVQLAERSVFTVTCPRASAYWLFDLIEGFGASFYADSCRPAALWQEAHVVMLLQVDVLACMCTLSPFPQSTLLLLLNFLHWSSPMCKS